jgi:hypothetical protein
MRGKGDPGGHGKPISQNEPQRPRQLLKHRTIVTTWVPFPRAIAARFALAGDDICFCQVWGQSKNHLSSPAEQPPRVAQDCEGKGTQVVAANRFRRTSHNVRANVSSTAQSSPPGSPSLARSLRDLRSPGMTIWVDCRGPTQPSPVVFHWIRSLLLQGGPPRPVAVRRVLGIRRVGAKTAAAFVWPQ